MATDNKIKTYIKKKLKRLNPLDIDMKEECREGANCGGGKKFSRLMSFKPKKNPSHPGPGTKTDRYVPVPVKPVETEVVTGKVAGGVNGNFPGKAKVETYDSTPVMNAAEEEELEKQGKKKGRETAYKLHKKKNTVIY